MLIKYGNCIGTSATIVKKKTLDDNKIYFNEEKIFATADDYDLWMRLAMVNVNFKFLHKVLGDHPFLKDSWGYKISQLHKNSILSLLKHHIFYIQNFTEKKENLWSHVAARFMIDEIRDLYYAKTYFKAINLFLKLLYKYPTHSIVQIYFKVKKKIITKIYDD